MDKCFRIKDRTVEWLNRLTEKFLQATDRQGVGPLRNELIGKARGTVLEIASGIGNNLPYDGRGVRRLIVAADPQAASHVKHAAAHARSVQPPVLLVTARAESLPFPDHAFDTVAGTMIFVDINDAQRATMEMRRVLKPGGQLLLFEHARINRPIMRHLRDQFAFPWRHGHHVRITHLNLQDLVTEAGFHIRSARQYGDVYLLIEAVNKKVKRHLPLLFAIWD